MVEFFGNFGKPCLDLSHRHACGSSTLRVLPPHLVLNAWNLIRTCSSSLNDVATCCATSTTCWFSVTRDPLNSCSPKLQKQLCLSSEGVLEPGTSIRFLGRCITRREDSIEMSTPTSYIDKMHEQLDMLKCRRAATPGTDSLRKLIDSEELLSPEDHRLHRRIVGQLLWLSSIRPDIQFAVKELSRGLTSPTEDHRTKMKTLLRYLAGTKPMVLTLRPKIIPHSKQTTFDINTYVDSDWAGCATSRRKASGMALYFLALWSPLRAGRRRQSHFPVERPNCTQ